MSGMNPDIHELVARAARESLLGLPLYLVRAWIWPWLVLGEDEAMLPARNAVMETVGACFETAGFGGCGMLEVGSIGEPGELLVTSHVVLESHDTTEPAAAHVRLNEVLQIGLRDVLEVPVVKVRTLWTKIEHLDFKLGDEHGC